MDLEYLLENPKGRCLGSFIRANYPDEYEIISKLPGKKFSEKLFRYFHPDIKNECIICGSPTAFKSINEGFLRCCCRKCSYKDPQRAQRGAQTKLERYGSTTYNNRGKFLETMGDREWGFKDRDHFRLVCQQKYGVTNPSQAKIVKIKKEQTCLQNHGTTNALRLDHVREAGRKAMIDKYGVDALFKIPEFQKKVHEKWREEFISSHDDVINVLADGTWVCKCPHPECTKCQERTYLSRNQIYNDRKRYNSEQCTKLLPIGHTNQGSSIEIFIRDILDRNNIPYTTNDRSILTPKEIDIYCPDYKIAIECNGCYWHNDNIKESNYHLSKFETCEAQGIQLLQIWEDWYHTKPQIVESMLLSKFGIYKHRIGARHCQIRQVTKNHNQFFNQNHIQGACKSKVVYGLYYKDQCVAMMAFNKRSKWANDDCWELVRFCPLLNWQVIGGADKLLRHFTSQYHPTKIVSFSANDISSGALYKRLGFQQFSRSQAYWYIQQGTFRRFHRTSFCKARLKQMGMDTSKTEREIMSELPYWRIYDSGTTGWQLLL